MASQNLWSQSTQPLPTSDDEDALGYLTRIMTATSEPAQPRTTPLATAVDTVMHRVQPRVGLPPSIDERFDSIRQRLASENGTTELVPRARTNWSRFQTISEGLEGCVLLVEGEVTDAVREGRLAHALDGLRDLRDIYDLDPTLADCISDALAAIERTIKDEL